MFLTTILFIALIGIVTQPSLALPDGAVARLGEGRIGSGDRAVQFSPDGTLLTEAISIYGRIDCKIAKTDAVRYIVQVVAQTSEVFETSEVYRRLEGGR